MDHAEAIAYLTKDGNLYVPCSRYGRDSKECAEVTWDVSRRVDYDCGIDELDFLMGLVVNDDDDIAYMIANYPNHDEGN